MNTKKSRFRLHGIIVVLFFCSGLFNDVTAEEVHEQDGENLPITVTSDRMEGDFKSGVIVFIGGVKVIRGEMVMHADKVDVQTANSGQDVERIIAQGNARVISGTRSSISDRVEYVQAQDLLVLTGNAKVSDGNNTISGPLIRVYLKEDRAEVEGSTGERPKFLFHPDTLKKPKP
ncbi:MAG: lipopolysaccharide transport periplasmic protein LptA [bacterium]